DELSALLHQEISDLCGIEPGNRAAPILTADQDAAVQQIFLIDPREAPLPRSALQLLPRRPEKRQRGFPERTRSRDADPERLTRRRLRLRRLSIPPPQAHWFPASS